MIGWGREGRREDSNTFRWGKQSNSDRKTLYGRLFNKLASQGRAYSDCGEAPCPHHPLTHAVKRVRQNILPTEQPRAMHLLKYYIELLFYSATSMDEPPSPPASCKNCCTNTVPAAAVAACSRRRVPTVLLIASVVIDRPRLPNIL